MPFNLIDIPGAYRPLLLVTALPFETRVFLEEKELWRLEKGEVVRCYHHRSGEVALCQTGVGFRQADNHFRKLLQTYRPALVVNVGIAGALEETLPLFSSYLIEEVYSEKGERFDLRSLLPAPYQTGMRSFPGARLLTVSQPVLDDRRRRALRRQSGCTLVDMEAFLLAQRLRGRKTRVVFLKVVSDFANQKTVEEVKARVPGLQKRLYQTVEQLFDDLKSP